MSRPDASGAVVNSVKIGSFAGAIVDFLIIAFVIQWLTNMLVKPAPAAVAVPMKTCGECRECVRAEMRKCRYCGSAV